MLPILERDEILNHAATETPVKLPRTMRFRTTVELAKIIAFAQGKSEENLDRLETELAAIQ